jgi:HEAT repeats
MLNTMNQSPRCAKAPSSVLRHGTVLLLGAALAVGQSRIAKPPQTNSNASPKRTHVATLRSSDSSEGSRVVLSSDQSLNNYEAYRRGDRFYVRIPAADVPRTEAVRGRGFADVKAQRIGDSTVVSFRLQPGSSAHVEQRANRLDVVFTVVGGTPSTAANTGRDTSRTVTSAEPTRNSNVNKRATTTTQTNKNSADRSTTLSNSNTSRNANNLNSASKTGATKVLAANSSSKPAATPQASPAPSVSGGTSPQNLNQRRSASPVASPNVQATPVSAATQPRSDRWGQVKEKINYWILLAQLNPIPVATGVVVLLLLLALFLVQRRRAKSPRRARSSIVKSSKTTTTRENVPVAQTAAPTSSVADAVPDVAAAALAAGALVSETTPEPVVVPVPDSTRPGDPRRDRIAQVNDEATKLMAGKNYDESVIGSEDQETRQLVGTELLAAIVGRNPERRERARDAFMKHGYFEDATRDLRVAGSANERAAAARRLSFVQDREATPHLVGALDDPSPDVRRAAVEALMDMRDPAAIGPLNSLLQTENDRKVPRPIIKQAIEACATATPEGPRAVATPSYPSHVIPDPASQSNQSEREVIEL